MLLFGGAFDPPHIGHMALLKNAMDTVRPVLTLVVPSGRSPHKENTETPAKTRLAMCECFKALPGRVEISDVEVCRAGKSYTLDTVRQLRRETPQAEVYLSIGGDMLYSFTEWHCYQELLAEAVLVVQSRQDERIALRQAAAALENEGGRVLFAEGETPKVSSSELRKMLVRQEAAALDLVPPPVGQIIRRQKLYGYSCM